MSRAQFLASGLWWWCGNGFHDSCVQNWMCKHPLYGLALSPPFHVFIPTSASSFTRFHPLTFPPTISYYASVTLQCFGPHPWSPEALPVIKFTISVRPCSLAKSKGVWPGNHSWHSNWPLPMYHISFQVINIRTAHYSHWLTGIQEESPLQMSKTRMNSKITCFNKMCCIYRDRDMTCPKITSLEFQGSFEDGNLRWEIQGNPMPIEVERTWYFKFLFIKTCHIELQLLLWLPVKNCCQNGCDIGWGPQPLSFLTSTEAFAASSSLALSTWPRNAARCSGVEPQQRRRRRHHLLRLPGGSELPGRGCSGRPRPRPSPGERRRPPRGRRLLPAAARPGGCLPRPRSVGRGSAGRGAGGPAPPPGRRRAPLRRCCRLGARRNAAEMKFLSSFDLYVLFSLSPSLLLMEIILNKLETELIELL